MYALWLLGSIHVMIFIIYSLSKYFKRNNIQHVERESLNKRNNKKKRLLKNYVRPVDDDLWVLQKNTDSVRLKICWADYNLT